MKNKSMKVIGYAIESRSHAENPTPVGTEPAVVGVPPKAYRQQLAPDGTVIGFTELTAAERFVFIHSDVTAQIGSPHVVVLVTDPAKPEAVVVKPWDEMVEKILAEYPTMRSAMLKFPLAGHRTANFVLALAPAYAAASNPRKKVDTERYGPELDLLTADDEHTYRRSPEVRALALATGIDLQPTRRVEILP